MLLNIIKSLDKRVKKNLSDAVHKAFVEVNSNFCDKNVSTVDII